MLKNQASFYFSLSFVSFCQQALHSDEQNITQLPNCLLPFVPLRKLTENLNGEEILRHISRYKEVAWSPQQVNILPRATLWQLFLGALMV